MVQFSSQIVTLSYFFL